ncbi:hypothetical protein P175DRAFT_0497179 [Aspergillus ochraceoroseus IBT 24754]|uniref:Uncharacterized protein n=1 Tax=Aspergillus ochraceoroseus IBT 24754 TaxID=1392256 RepID=A0A2T5M6A9_9EURO|nr:uncharacterized protein P175DRAFT_0497179 [Aspergillus ochraceoroseus IBT 24754]PTU24064.1 hypothetical protein P175DRAFT_0497179 [Aspergillus ochraceoroseus IBT 24754]
MADSYSSQTDQGDDDSNNNSNKTTTIIIGVVVGGVCAICIAATVIFILYKKRKWDRIRQCEERLLDYQLATSYSKSRSVTPEDHCLDLGRMPPALAPGPGPGLLQQPQYARDPSNPSRRSRSATLEAPPPAYQSLHPRYDPSRYSNISRTSAAFDLPKSSNANNGGLSISIPSSEGPGGLAWYHHQQQQQQQRESMLSTAYSVGDWPLSSTLDANTRADTRRLSTAATAPQEERRGPQRPKPVLSRLVTNF